MGNVENDLPTRPGEPFHEYSLWEIHTIQGPDGQVKEVGVNSPDGTYYNIETGEHFVINKGIDNDSYEAVIIGPNGERRVLKSTE